MKYTDYIVFVVEIPNLHEHVLFKPKKFPWVFENG